MSTSRHICYLTGTRADFGLMASTLDLLHKHPSLKLSVLVTGMHLEPAFGLTVNEIEQRGFDIVARIPCQMENADGGQMARNIGLMLQHFVDVFQGSRPDVLLLLGDRGEMLAGALAAIHLGIPVVHLHGGERSGTVDEAVRHAISKLAHLHLTATEGSRERLIKMGERPDLITVVGAPGLDGLVEQVRCSRQQLCVRERLDPEEHLALLVFHPVLQEAAQAGEQTTEIVQTLLNQGYQVLALMPNADAGSSNVRSALSVFDHPGRLVLKTHLPRPEFVDWMAAVDVMVGNSSSGIIEAASLGTPVINLGSRQNMRERNLNVVDIPICGEALRDALADLGPRAEPPYFNVYGDGKTGQRITDYLASVTLAPALLDKCNAY